MPKDYGNNMCEVNYTNEDLIIDILKIYDQFKLAKKDQQIIIDAQNTIDFFKSVLQEMKDFLYPKMEKLRDERNNYFKEWDIISDKSLRLYDEDDVPNIKIEDLEYEGDQYYNEYERVRDMANNISEVYYLINKIRREI